MSVRTYNITRRCGASLRPGHICQRPVRFTGGRCSRHTATVPPAPTAETVAHPSHYNAGKIEVITVIEDWDLNFNEGNVIKYVARARRKGKHIEDLKKARQYLDFEIARIERSRA